MAEGFWTNPNDEQHEETHDVDEDQNQGHIWSRNYFPNDWFGKERMSWGASTTSLRSERITRLGVRLAWASTTHLLCMVIRLTSCRSVSGFGMTVGSGRLQRLKDLSRFRTNSFRQQQR